MNGNVKIINYNTNADSIVASAGRISTTREAPVKSMRNPVRVSVNPTET